MSKKTYAIMGATGHIGHALSEKLLGMGHAVRALGRDAKKLSALKAKGAETLSPAFDDAKGLAEAFKGADGVFVMIPPNYAADDFSGYQDKSGEAIAQAIAQSGVKHVVSLSSIGAEQPSGTGPIAGLYRQEQRLNKLSGVDIVHLRPASFMENQFWSIPVIKGNGINGSATPDKIPLPTVATQDIGAKAAELLDGLHFKGHEAFDFAGPREYTMAEVTTALG
ncbi:MAG TPA: NAD(P)H-binding protein, partial [bacterium]|nr:NAD(P)H-binding protein [bacterium]